MDLSADSGTLPTHTTVGGPALGRGLSLSSARCQTESGSTILLQLLEFKTHLLEAVEELHIRRALPPAAISVALGEVEKRGDVRTVPDIPEQDAETRFEDQISKLVLEKQELEWEKESLHHQAETAGNQHAESLINVKKQFQAKIRNIEEEKVKYQVSAELKDKEINNLKEELKSLQLLKYNLEKKSSELEQKLVLQSRSKDSHLNQLGEVEKRFSALSRQCAVVKQAHEKLEQNVDEAIKRNKKLTSANDKQEATIVSLTKELEAVSNSLIKARMSAVAHDKSYSPTGREQCIQQLHQMEAEMNKKLREETEAVRAEKQEVMKSLQHTQQLLLSQTQTVSRVELDLQAQREQYQALKQEHEVMREKCRATEDKVAQLMESYAASKTSWDKERTAFLERIKSEQLGLRAVSGAYDELHQKHTELSSQAKAQAQHIYELESQSSQSLCVTAQLVPTLLEDIRGEETLNESISSSESPGFGSLQSLDSPQTEKPDCLEDTGSVTKLATGGRDGPNQHTQSQTLRHTLNLSDLTSNKHVSLRSLSGTTGTSVSNRCSNNCDACDLDVASDLIHTTSPVSADDLLVSEGSFASSPDHRSVSGSVDSRSKEKSDGGISETEQRWKDGVKGGESTREEEEGNEEPQWKREEVQGENVKEGGSAEQRRGMLVAQTTDRADRLEDSQRSTKDAGDTKQSDTETKDRGGGEGTEGMEERGRTGPHTPETQIPAQTATDTTTERSDALQVIDFMDAEPSLAACEPSDCSQHLPQQVSETVSDSSHVNNGCEIRKEVNSSCSDEQQSVSHGPDSVMRRLCHDENKTQDSLPQVFDRTTEEKPGDQSAADIPTEPPGPLNQSRVCNSQTSTAASAAHSSTNVDIQELDTTATQTQPTAASDRTNNMKQTEETCVRHTREDCVSVSTTIEPQSQGISEQECGQLTSLLTDDDDSSVYKKKECQSDVDTREDDAQEPVEKSNLKDACVDIVMDTVDLESEVETGSRQEKDEGENPGDAKTTKTVVHPSQEIDASPETGGAKYHEPSPAEEDPNGSSLNSNKVYRSSFDWASRQSITGPPGQNPHGPLRHSSTIPMFLKSKPLRVPSVITGTSDLLCASGVSGNAVSSRRHQQGKRKATGGTCRETSTADMSESRASPSISSLPVSTSSITVSRMSWQTTPGCSRAPTSGPTLESFWGPSCSQEAEDQQSSFRSQIAKIEQFLNTERLRLPKRRPKSDN